MGLFLLYLLNLVFVKGGLKKSTKSKCSVGRCCTSFPSRLLRVPLHFCCCFYTVPPYSRNAVFLLCGQIFAEFWDETSSVFFSFLCAWSKLGFLWLGSWCSDVAEQRVKKQSIRPCCHFLLSSAPRK